MGNVCSALKAAWVRLEVRNGRLSTGRSSAFDRTGNTSPRDKQDPLSREWVVLHLEQRFQQLVRDKRLHLLRGRGHYSKPGPMRGGQSSLGGLLIQALGTELPKMALTLGVSKKGLARPKFSSGFPDSPFPEKINHHQQNQFHLADSPEDSPLECPLTKKLDQLKGVERGQAQKPRGVQPHIHSPTSPLGGVF